MTASFDLLFVSTYALSSRLPTRSSWLLRALRAEPTVRSVTTIDRCRPSQLGRFARGRSFELHRQVDASLDAIEHPWPFGRLETRWLERYVRRRVARSDIPVVVWVADPKSAPFLSRVHDVPPRRLVRVFDAYDAWDLSPLVRGRRRRSAVLAGYTAAARHADVVFANTAFMGRRMRDLGATNASILPNAAPVVEFADVQVQVAGPQPYLVYVGRIHERVDVDLLAAVAEAFPTVLIRMIGPVEREPSGWQDYVARPNVRLDGPLVGEQLLATVGASAALLVPHCVDDYTLSQDAMKAWDALAVGTAVISTPVPPVIDWPAGLATVGADAKAFVGGVRTVLDGQPDGARAARLAYARANGWDARAGAAVRAITAIIDP